MSKAEQMIELGRAVRKWQLEWQGDEVWATRDIHEAMVNHKVFVSVDQEKKGWALLAKLAAYEYPGVRIGEPQRAAWKNMKREVRPKEWHHAPTAEEMIAWEDKVRGHRSTMASASMTALTARVTLLEGQCITLKSIVERLEKEVAELRKTVR